MIDGKMDSQEFAVWSSFFRVALTARIPTIIEARIVPDEEEIVEDAKGIADQAFKEWTARRELHGL